MDSPENRLSCAKATAREAGALALDYFRRVDQLSVEAKGLQDYVTEADREVEKLIRRTLLHRFQQDGFLGEESGEVVGTGVWVVDPIDGTGNFVRGIPCFTVSIAYVADDNHRVGVIYDPISDELFEASSSSEARCNDAPITCRSNDELNDAVIAFGVTPDVRERAFSGPLLKWLNAGVEYRRFGSAVLSLAYVAAGRIDAFAHTGLNSWDAAAGLIIAERAGAAVSEFPRAAFDRRVPVLAANPGLFPRMSADLAATPRQ